MTKVLTLPADNPREGARACWPNPDLQDDSYGLIAQSSARFSPIKHFEKKMLTTEKIDIENLVKTELPPLSNSAMRVSTLVQDVNSSTNSIAQAIGFDPVLTARILRAANSPLYAMERRVTTLPSAVNTLGNRTLYALAIISTASDTFDASLRRNPAGQKLWSHLVTTGLVARELSRLLGMRGSDEAFLCGLLHDIGKLVMLKHHEELYARLDEVVNEEESLMLEQELYGYTHAQVGALITKHWGLPEEIGYAIYSHHQPSEARQHQFMARLVDVANQLAHAGENGELTEEKEILDLSESVVALQLTVPQLYEAWNKAETKIGEMMSCFK
jgi:putative nucleotidyltransferase with HDIG domain